MLTDVLQLSVCTHYILSTSAYYFASVWHCVKLKTLHPAAGADKKAEAGAGAATEFQFVSITV